MENFEKEPVKRVKIILSKFNSKIKIISLNSSARTAKDAANSLSCDIGAIVKSLLFKDEKNYFICLVAGDKRCSLKKLKFLLKKSDISMANADEVKEYTGFSIGGVSPVGHTKTLDILIDKSLKRFQDIYAAAGHPNYIFKITYKELVEITNGSEKEFSE